MDFATGPTPTGDRGLQLSTYLRSGTGSSKYWYRRTVEGLVPSGNKPYVETGWWPGATSAAADRRPIRSFPLQMPVERRASGFTDDEYIIYQVRLRTASGEATARLRLRTTDYEAVIAIVPPRLAQPTLRPPTTFRYDRYDTTGAVAEPGSYAFLAGPRRREERRHHLRGPARRLGDRPAHPRDGRRRRLARRLPRYRRGGRPLRVAAGGGLLGPLQGDRGQARPGLGPTPGTSVSKSIRTPTRAAPAIAMGGSASRLRPRTPPIGHRRMSSHRPSRCPTSAWDVPDWSRAGGREPSAGTVPAGWAGAPETGPIPSYTWPSTHDPERRRHPEPGRGPHVPRSGGPAMRSRCRDGLASSGPRPSTASFRKGLPLYNPHIETRGPHSRSVPTTVVLPSLVHPDECRPQRNRDVPNDGSPVRYRVTCALAFDQGLRSRDR